MHLSQSHFQNRYIPIPPTAPPLSQRPSLAVAFPRKLRRAAAEAPLRKPLMRGRAEDNGNPSTPGLRRGGSPAVFEAWSRRGRQMTCDAEPPPGLFPGRFYGVATWGVPVTF